MPDATLQPEPAPDAALYPAGHLASLPYEALITERDRQRAREKKALAEWEIDNSQEAAIRARLCTQEIIRRRLAALSLTEPTRCES